MTFKFQARSSASWRWGTLKATKHQQQKMLKTFENSSSRPSPNNPWARRHAGISYWVCQEILTENWNMRRIAPSSRQRARTHVPENHRVCDYQQQGYRPPFFLLTGTSPPVPSLGFPNWKWNWGDDALKQCLISKGNRQRHSTALRNMTSTVLLKHGKDDGIAVYVPKEMAAKIE
jgi:hypothetical protein